MNKPVMDDIAMKENSSSDSDPGTPPLIPGHFTPPTLPGRYQDYDRKTPPAPPPYEAMDVCKPQALIKAAGIKKSKENSFKDSLANSPASNSIQLPRKFEIESLITKYPKQEIVASTTFTWKIEDWSRRLKETEHRQKIYSEEFEIDGRKWNVLMFPQGNTEKETFSLFLNCLDVIKDDKEGVCAKFALSVCNPSDQGYFSSKEAHHRFSNEECDWGFSSFMSVSELEHPIEAFGKTEKKSILENDALLVIAHVQVVKDETGVLWHKFTNWDSRKETGFVGLKNQGATCYMNSLLQSLYFTNYFRRAVFRIPTEDDDYSKSIPLALQHVFYQLQYSDQAVGTTELTKSFGWDTMDSFMQHDVQEFNRVLQETLETKMKKTEVEGFIEKLFVGKMRSYIKCVNVDYQSSREENFYDIQLNVKGCKDLYESFKEYIKVEMLDGENKYNAEGHGLQDAKMGVIFTKFPPVLHLQLKRFDYDMQRDMMVKINDRHEFPLEIDLKEFLAEEATDTIPPVYHLHGVLVHSGDVHGGHYCAFIKPSIDSEQWYKFDDDRVIPVSIKEALNDNFGGEVESNLPLGPRAQRWKRFTNAYMLVYIRDSERREMLRPLDKDDLPSYLVERFEKERLEEEKRRKEKIEAHYSMTVKVLTNEYLSENVGVDLCFHEDDLKESMPCFRVRKDETWANVKNQLSLSNPIEYYRFWVLVKRQNHTWRPDCFILPADEGLSVFQVKEKYCKTWNELRLFAEPSKSLAPSPPVFEPVNDGKVMILLKYYDIETKKLSFGGSIICGLADRIQDLIPSMCQSIGLPVNTSVSVYEEVKPMMVDVLRLKSTVQAAELVTGDILCIQKETNDENVSSVVDYMAHRVNRVTVHFKPLEGQDKEFSLELSKQMSYEQVASLVGSELEADPMKIRFFSKDQNGAIKKQANLNLASMLSHNSPYYSQSNDTLLYERLEMSIVEFESKKILKVTLLDEHVKEKEVATLILDKTFSVKEALIEISSKFNNQPVRLYGANQSRIMKEYVDEDKISQFQEYDLYAEVIPPEEKNAVKIANVIHFNKDVLRTHGIPFKFPLKQGEKFEQTKARLATKLQVPEKEFSKYKFFYGQYSKTRPIEDDEVIADAEFNYSDFIGIDHVDKNGKSWRGFEKAIKIHN